MIALRGARLRAAALGSAVLVAVAVSACGGSAPEVPVITPGQDPTATSPAATPTPTSSPSTEPSPAPTETDPVGPTAAPREGSEVTPDLFMVNVDAEAGELRVVVYVPEIFEDGGQCTVTAQAGSIVKTQENTGVADVTSTACGLFTFPLADFPSGTVTVTAEYQSQEYAGTSGPTEVQVP